MKITDWKLSLKTYCLQKENHRGLREPLLNLLPSYSSLSHLIFCVGSIHSFLWAFMHLGATATWCSVIPTVPSLATEWPWRWQGLGKDNALKDLLWERESSTRCSYKETARQDQSNLCGTSVNVPQKWQLCEDLLQHLI